MKSNPQVLITGGAGYIGSILTPTLLNKGCTVTVVDNFLYGQPSLLDCCHHPDFNIIRGDARDERIMLPLLKKADVIMPLACLVGAPLCEQKPIEARSTNLDAITMLIRNASAAQRFISPTTNSGYGIVETSVFCTEETPMNPVSLYGVLKVELEKALLDADAISLRLATEMASEIGRAHV